MRGRALGNIAAIGLAVALAVTTLGLANSASAQVSQAFDAHLNRDVAATWTPEQTSGQTGAAVASIANRLESLSGVDAAALLVDYGHHAVQPAFSRPALSVESYVEQGSVELASRSVIRREGDRSGLGPGEVIVGASLANQLELGPLQGTPHIMLDGRSVGVVGIIDDSPRKPELLGSIILSSQDTRYLGERQSYEALILTQPGAAQQVARQVPLVISPQHPTQVHVSAPVDPTTLRAQVESAVGGSLLALTIVAIVSAIAALANSMISSVMERRSEFGLRRAIGARPLHLFGLVVAESSVLGIIGGIAGLGAGLTTLLTITIVRHWTPVFDLRLAPVAVAAGVLVGILGGIVASLKAAQVQPSDALRL